MKEAHGDDSNAKGSCMYAASMNPWLLEHVSHGIIVACACSDSLRCSLGLFVTNVGMELAR